MFHSISRGVDHVTAVCARADFLLWSADFEWDALLKEPRVSKTRCCLRYVQETACVWLRNIPSGLRAEAVKRVGEYRGASVSDVVTPWGYIDKQAAGSSSKLTLHETGLFCCHWFFLLSFPWYRIKERRFLFMWHSVCLIKRRVAI